MAQVEAPANLDRWPSPEGRLVTMILIQCGLRATDACTLAFDILKRYIEHTPRFDNVRARYLALEDDLLKLLAYIRSLGETKQPLNPPESPQSFQQNSGAPTSPVNNGAPASAGTSSANNGAPASAGTSPAKAGAPLKAGAPKGNQR